MNGATATESQTGPKNATEVYLILGVGAWRALEQSGMAKGRKMPERRALIYIGREIVRARFRSRRRND